MTQLVVRNLKVVMVLDPAAVRNLKPGGGARVALTIEAAGRTVRADIATKSLRKVQAMIDQHGVDGVAVILQGRLLADDTLEDGGLVAQERKPKAEAAPAAA